MLKKSLLISSLISVSAFAVNDAQIEGYFKSKIPVPAVQVKVNSRIPITQIQGMDYVSLDISDGTRTQKVSVFTQGDLIFPDVISVKDGGSIKDKLDKQKLTIELSKLYKSEAKENIVVLGTDPKKETIVVFTDPECPFCNKEVANIEQKLETNNLRLIFTPVHDKSSLEKSMVIYKQTSVAKSIEEKIKIIKKYFNSDLDEKISNEKVSDEEVTAMEDLRKKYFSAGLQGVPFMVDEKELLK